MTPPAALPVEPAAAAPPDPAAAAVQDPATAGALPDPSELFGAPPEPQPVDPIAQLGSQVNSLAEMIAQSQQRQQGQDPNAAPDPFESWDPFDPQSVLKTVTDQIMGQLGPMLDQRLGGIEQVSNMFAEREATQVAERHFATIEEQIGEFDHSMALEFLGHALAQGGDPSRALVESAHRAQQYGKQLMVAGATKYRELLERAAAGASDPAAGAAGATPVPEVTPQGDESPYKAQGRATMGRLRALPPPGV